MVPFHFSFSLLVPFHFSLVAAATVSDCANQPIVISVFVVNWRALIWRPTVARTIFCDESGYASLGGLGDAQLVSVPHDRHAVTIQISVQIG